VLCGLGFAKLQTLMAMARRAGEIPRERKRERERTSERARERERERGGGFAAQINACVSNEIPPSQQATNKKKKKKKKTRKQLHYLRFYRFF